MTHEVLSGALASVLGVLGAAVIAAIFRGIFMLRDNTKAIVELSGVVKDWRGTSDSAHSALEQRIQSLENWRLTTESVTLTRLHGLVPPDTPQQ